MNAHCRNLLHTLPRLILLAAAMPLVLCPSAGCKKDSAHESAAVTTPAAGTYEVRGVIKALPPKAGAPMSITHEEIPDFKNRAGKAVGMKSMTMPFHLKDGVSHEGIEVGDKVSFTYESRFEGGPANLVTRMEKLPPDTELELKK